MTTPNRAAQIGKLQKVLKKHFKPVAPPADRTVLEHILYACILENARYEAADEAFAKLRELYFDWNEIRVTTVTELAENMTGIPDAQAAGQRIKKVLQSVFETAYSFDIEPLRKQNIGKSEKDLDKIAGVSRFVREYVTQHALDGHSIPISPTALEVLYAVGIIDDAEIEKQVVPGIERAIPKNKGTEFASLLQQIAADYHDSPGSSKLRAILAEVDGEFKERIAKRAARLEETAAKAAVAREKEREKARAEARAARQAEQKPNGKESDKSQAAKSQAAKGDASRGKDAAPKSSPKPPVGEKPRADSKAQPTAAPERRGGEKAGGEHPARPRGKDHKEKEKAAPPPAPKKEAAGESKGKKSTSKGLTKKKPR